jgi:hypothetical protein
MRDDKIEKTILISASDPELHGARCEKCWEVVAPDSPKRSEFEPVANIDFADAVVGKLADDCRELGRARAEFRGKVGEQESACGGDLRGGKRASRLDAIGEKHIPEPCRSDPRDEREARVRGLIPAGGGVGLFLYKI